MEPVIPAIRPGDSPHATAAAEPGAGAATGPAATRPAADAVAASTVDRLPVVALLDALAAWHRAPSAVGLAAVRRTLAGVVATAGADGAYLDIGEEPLGPLAVGVGTLGHRTPDRETSETSAPHELTTDDGGTVVGRLWVEGTGPAKAEAARAVERTVLAAWSVEEARDMTVRLEALDEATRAVAGVLSVDRVLQAIVDRVRELVGARYAALGTTDQEGQIDRFLTSGITRTERERIGALPRGRGLLGKLIREGVTVRAADIATHAEHFGFPPNHPEMRSFLGVPLVAKGRIVGNLYLTEKSAGRPFTGRDQRIVEMFASHAAVAIDNARLHEQIQRLAVVEERERIGKDLHDGIIQAIYAVGLSLEDVPDLMETDTAQAVTRVDRAIENLNLAIRDIRNFIFGLRPELLEQAGVQAGLAALADEFRLNTMIDVDLLIDGQEAIEMPEEGTIQLLHIAREALSNVARHSRATRATIELASGGDELRLVIADNGCGFSVDAMRGPEHQGLVNMRTRASDLGGTLGIESGPDDGTRIIVTVPHLDAESNGESGA